MGVAQLADRARSQTTVVPITSACGGDQADLGGGSEGGPDRLPVRANVEETGSDNAVPRLERSDRQPGPEPGTMSPRFIAEGGAAQVQGDEVVQAEKAAETSRLRPAGSRPRVRHTSLAAAALPASTKIGRVD